MLYYTFVTALSVHIMVNSVLLVIVNEIVMWNNLF
jgi:hypothetical protein